ncbi:HlyD family efflux transporter periplasmic adaptor subunit [Nocardioides sp. GCM10030258]|uniref:HlyD family efflux transporter periplasmic adaptor subunit n=1 Tax=unclassified Nocardioides TaxID=2615069 RepID=UPI0036142EE8
MRALIRARRVALPLAALALAGTGIAAYGAVADEAPQYRTVAASVGDVDQVLSLAGVIESSGRSDLAFGANGTVARVPVAQGDPVDKGDVIAVLDRAALRAAVDRAKSDLAKAKAQLAEDRDAQASAVSTAATSTTDTSSVPTPAARSSAEPTKDTGSGSPGNAALLARLAAQQDAVIAAQKSASAALATGAEALTTQQQACAASDTPAEPTGTPTEDASDDASEDPGTSSGVSDECQASLAAVQSAQAATASAQAVLQTALETLGATLTAALGTVEEPDQDGADDTADDSGDDSGDDKADTGAAAPGAGDTTGSPDGQAARTVTAATLAQDQASIDRSAADLASAQASLRAAVVRAPADGTVLSLAVAPGGSVSSGDTVAILVAPGLTTVSLEVTATQAAQLKAGAEVDVTPAGASASLKGSISRVENVPASSDSGEDPTYSVEVTLDERDLSLPDGIRAAVAVVVGSADDVVTVPASAVVDGAVTVLDAGQARRTRVTTGIVGSTEVEIVDGLDAGEEVVLADLGADLPSADNEDQGGDRIEFGGPGGFSGGGPPRGVVPGR